MQIIAERKWYFSGAAIALSLWVASYYVPLVADFSIPAILGLLGAILALIIYAGTFMLTLRPSPGLGAAAKGYATIFLIFGVYCVIYVYRHRY
jgi:hypothetical protein